MNVTFRQLRLFLALAETGSVSGAARVMHVTQPTASMQLREVTQAVGLPLYEVISRRVHLTEAGIALARTARAMVGEWESLTQTVDGLKGLTRGRLRLAVVFSTLKEKDILRIEGPYGSFYLREDSQAPIILLASGTGFAPIKALIEHMQHKGIARPATLYWGGRRPADLYMNDWVETQVKLMPNLKYVPVVSDALPEDAWTGRTGFVHQAVLQDHPSLSEFQVYACGAPIVVDSARADYVGQAGLPDEAFFADSFTTEADKAKESD